MKNFIYIYSNIIVLDAAYSLEENNEDLRLELEEDPYELHYGLGEEDHSSVIFNIPEDNSEAGCYVRVERSARLERVGCDQDAWLVGDGASPSGTR